MPTLSNELWRAYLHTQYDVELSSSNVVSLAVGRPANGLDECWAADSEAFFITAHNPFSQRLSERENNARQRQLEQQAKDSGWRFWPAVARDIVAETAKKWPDERGVMLFGATMQAAVRLAAEFQQHAIVRVPRSGNVECVVVETRCKT